MVQPQRITSWLFPCFLTCLLALSIATPRVWNAGLLPTNKSDAVSSTAEEGDLSGAIADDELPPATADIVAEQEKPVDPAAAKDTPAADVTPAAADNVTAKSEEPKVTDLQLPQLPSADTLLEDRNTAQPSAPKNEPAEQPAAAGPKPIEPAKKIGTEVAPAEKQERIPEPENKPAEPKEPVKELTDPIKRLPAIVANLPSTVRNILQDDVRPAGETFYPDTNQPHPLSKITPPRKESEETKRHPEEALWQVPESLLENLKGLTSSSTTKKWANETIHQVRVLGPAVAGGSDESIAILERLTILDRQAMQMAKTLSDRKLAQKLSRTAFALGRRIDIWQEIARLGVPKSIDASIVPELEPEKLAQCLQTLEKITGDSEEGNAWREYLMVDALKNLTNRTSSAGDRVSRQTAQQALARMTQTPLTPHQQKFIVSEPVAALRDELRRWAAEPIGTATVLRDIEIYERTGLPSDARRLAEDCQFLAVSPNEGCRRLAERIDMHYRNASVRIAVTEELLNKLIPEQNWEYAPVEETVLGRPTRGERLMATELSLRMLPDPKRVRLALEVRGEIVSETTSDAGPATFHNDSTARYVARKPLEIDMHGITVWPVEVNVENDTQLTGVNTPLDPIPVLSSFARAAAKAGLDQNRAAASAEVKQKIAAQASDRINVETRERLAKVVDQLNERVFDPLNSLSLDPQMISGETTDKRFTMRLRLAGEDQLGSHTPRPQAPSDSLASFQIHESVINNGIQRLLLDGRTFTLPELSEHIAARLNRPVAWEINPENADVKITFAEKDSIVVRCQEGQVVLTLSIAQLSKGSRKWKNFQIRAFYKPEVNGRSAQLVRDGVIHLMGQRLNTSAQIALRGIFSRALSKNNAWNLLPEPVMKEPKLEYAAVTQFVVDDGWIGISLGPKPVTATRRGRLVK